MARNKFNIDEELDAPFNWPQFKRSLVYVKKYRKQIAAMFGLAVFSSLLALLTPRIQAYVIDSLIPQGHKAIATILILGGGYFLINIGTIFINRLKGVISVRTSQSMTTDMRTDVYTHLQKLGFDYYDSRPHGKILTRVINYVNNVSDFLTNGLINAVLALINLLIIFIFMITFSPKMTLVVLAGLPLFIVYVAVTKPMQRRYRQKAANKQSNVTAYLSENIAPNDDYPNGTYPYIMEKLELSTAELGVETNFVQFLLNMAISGGYAPGTDISSMITNAKFTNRTEGWVLSKAATSTTATPFLSIPS